MMKFVVIGCGNIAQRCSIPALMNSGVTEVVCVVDTDENKRAIVAERFDRSTVDGPLLDFLPAELPVSA